MEASRGRRPDRVRVGSVDIELVRGNIVEQPDVDAVVNAANAELRVGGGVAGAIHRAAGPGLEREAVPLGPIRPGQAVITAGHDLPNPNVIHCLGPVYGVDEPAEELLASAYRESLRLAEAAGLTSIAFPAISTGAFGYPVEAAARTAVSTVVDRAPALKSLRTVRFVLFDETGFKAHAKALAEAIDHPGESSD